MDTNVIGRLTLGRGTDEGMRREILDKLRIVFPEAEERKWRGDIDLGDYNGSADEVPDDIATKRVLNEIRDYVTEGAVYFRALEGEDTGGDWRYVFLDGIWYEQIAKTTWGNYNLTSDDMERLIKALEMVRDIRERLDARDQTETHQLALMQFRLENELKMMRLNY